MDEAFPPRVARRLLEGRRVEPEELGQVPSRARACLNFLYNSRILYTEYLYVL